MFSKTLLPAALVGAMLGCTAASAQNVPVAYIAPKLLAAAASADAETATQIFAEIGACRIKELNDYLAVNMTELDHVAIEIIPNSQQEKVTVWMNMAKHRHGANIPWTAVIAPYVTATIDRCQQK